MRRKIKLQGFPMKRVKKSMLIKVLVALCGLLPFLYPVNSPQSSGIQTEALTIVALGDSITWGYPNGESWTEMVMNDTGIRIINRGVSGSQLDDMLRRMKTDVIPVKPQICIIMGGTNDANRGRTTQQMMADIQTMANELMARDIMPVIGLPIPMVEQRQEEKLQDLRERIISSALLTIDFSLDFDLPRAEFRKLIPDGLHPTHEGKKMMAERLKKEMPRLLAAYSKFRK
ncbi:MAG: hypothetical protein J0L53_16290 [Spirochaetes bacterium]|nr:hypothetical protein [Spirochaetota bacterium]MBX3722242.1 hypothetical protein [Turneriella sp.]